MRKILAQGSLDGACFLYSIANAAQALSGRKFSEDDWTKAVRSAPFDMTDYLAGRGTEKIDKKPYLLQSMIHEFLSQIAPKFEVEWVEKLESIAELKNLLTPESVFVMSVDDDAHWVTVVDVDEKKIYSACSAMALYGPSPYSEDISLNYKRHWNRWDSPKELKAGKSYGLKISLKTKRAKKKLG